MSSRKLTPATFFATALGVGFLPKAPGTWGTLLAAAVYLLLPDSLFQGPGWLYYAGGLAVLTALAVWLSSLAERSLGHDAPQIVIDEVCGYFLAVAFIPIASLASVTAHNWRIALYAFVLFRAFDIAKPWPVNVSQRLPQGWGVVADDLLAGLYANLIIQLMLIITPRFFGI